MNESQSQPTTNKQSQTMFLYVIVFKNPHLGGPTPPFLSHPTHLVIYLDGPVNKKNLNTMDPSRRQSSPSPTVSPAKPVVKRLERGKLCITTDKPVIVPRFSSVLVI